MNERIDDTSFDIVTSEELAEIESRRHSEQLLQVYLKSLGMTMSPIINVSENENKTRFLLTPNN